MSTLANQKEKKHLKNSFLFFGLTLFALSSVPGFGASSGVIDCHERNSVFALERPGSLVVVRRLNCDQHVTVIGVDQGWVEIQINDRQRGFIEARNVRILAAEPSKPVASVTPPVLSDPVPSSPPAKLPPVSAPPPVAPPVVSVPPAPPVVSPPPEVRADNRPSNENAHDIITLRSGDDLEAIILEVMPDVVRYKRFTNQDGPTFIVEKAKIFMIRYADGSRDVFTDETPMQTQINMQRNPNYKRKSPALSWFLSSIVPGIGQFYNGDVGKGIGFMLSYFVGVGILNAGVIADDADVATIGGAIFLGSWIGAQIDAPVSASRKNRANRYLTWNFGSGDATLALQPNFKLESKPGESSLAPAYSMAVKLNF